MPEVRFVHPHGGDYRRALVETSDGMPVAEVAVTVDEEIYYNYMNALELYLKAKLAEGMLEGIGTLLEAGRANSVRKLTGDMCAMGGDGEIALREASEFRAMGEAPANGDRRRREDGP